MSNKSQKQIATEHMAANLMSQVDNMFNNCSEKSYKTRYRYRESAERFCDFLAEKYRLNKFANVKEKHIIEYIKHLQDAGYSAATIKTDLSGIRFFHGLSGGKFVLPENTALDLEKRSVGKVDRTWTDAEIAKALTLAKEMGRHDVYHAVLFSKSFGLRLEEVCRCTVSHLQDALINGELYVKGKGGQERYVPVVTKEQISVIEQILIYAKKSKKTKAEKVISADIRGGTLSAKKKIQNWISNHRSKFQEDFRKSDSPEKQEKGRKLRTANLSFHGLRYFYAQSKYDALKDDPDAKRKVSLELGHHRKSITNIYLSTDQKTNRKS